MGHLKNCGCKKCQKMRMKAKDISFDLMDNVEKGQDVFTIK